MPLQNDIQVIITDGGIGREASGKDWYSGLIFQSATVPASFTDNVSQKIYSIKDAIAKGITEQDFPVEYYHIEEFFRISEKLNISVWVSIMFSNIAVGTFAGDEIKIIQDANNGELRQIGVYLIDPFAVSFVSGADLVAETLNNAGFPTSIYLVADISDNTTLTDLRTLDKKWVSVLLAQDGNAKGKALFDSKGYSVGVIGLILGVTAGASVHERIGYVGKYDISGITEMQTLALLDDVKVSTLTDARIDELNNYGYTVAVKRRIAGSYVYTDAVTSSSELSDFTEQRLNRTIGKAKRLLLQHLAPMQNAPLYVNPATGQLTEQTIGVFNAICKTALDTLASKQEIAFDFKTGRIPKNSIIINPNQNVLATNKLVINAKIVPVGTAGAIEVNLSFTTATQ